MTARVITRRSRRGRVHLKADVRPTWFGRSWCDTVCGKSLDATAGGGWLELGRGPTDNLCRNCARIEAARLTGDCEIDCQQWCRGACGALAVEDRP